MAIVCTIDATGIHAPELNSIRSYLVEKFKAIYGGDVYLEADSQDGQWIDIIALALHDANAMAVSVYNAFSPSTAQGTGLSSVVKINGIARRLPSRSGVDLLIGGTAGTVITGGYATDLDGVQWVLPHVVTIPPAGQIAVMASCRDVGDISAPPNSIVNIGTPTRGWQTVSNPEAATRGAPVEADAMLRKRQTTSTALPSRTVVDGILGAVLDLPGVVRAKPYDNDSATEDENGIPAHALAMIVDGGDPVRIAEVIRLKKTPGSPTFGTTSEVIVDPYGIPKTISFFRPTQVPITIDIDVQALSGYTSTIGNQIKQAISDYINARDIGEDVYLNRLLVPANLTGNSNSSTFNIKYIQISRDGDPVGISDIVIAYNEAAMSNLDDINLTAS